MTFVKLNTLVCCYMYMYFNIIILAI